MSNLTIFKNIYISSDHAGVALRMFIIDFLKKSDYKVFDYGCDTTDDSVDYPDYVVDVVDNVEKHNLNCGILICGTGIGMSIAANRNKNIRAALCYNTNLAKLAREHNNANILCLGARYIDFSNAKSIVKTFLSTRFAEGRHVVRVNKLSKGNNVEKSSSNN